MSFLAGFKIWSPWASRVFMFGGVEVWGVGLSEWVHELCRFGMEFHNPEGPTYPYSRM